METTIPTLKPIDDGHVKQVVVEYLGPKRGGFLLRGRTGGQPYPFSALATGKWRYVLFEDIPWFQQRPDYRVHDETLIDPELEERRQLGSRIAALEHDQERTATAPPVAKAKVNNGGRPAIPLATVHRMWHLRNHYEPRWSISDLLSEFPCENCFDPKAAVSARLYRFKKEHPDLISPEDCSFCRKDDFLLPPSSV